MSDKKNKKHMLSVFIIIVSILFLCSSAVAVDMPFVLPNVSSGLPLFIEPDAEETSKDVTVKQGIVLCDTMLFAKPEDGAQAVAEASIGQELDVYVVNVNGSWDAVMWEDAIVYIAAADLSVSAPTRDEKPEIHLTDGGQNGYPGEKYNDPEYLKLIAEAKKYIGMPYVWGGSTPETSFDCSGYVCWVLDQSEVYPIKRTDAQGIYGKCIPIDKADARPGDLIFFRKTYETTNTVTHVAIYVGNDYMLHCGKPIGYSRIDTPYWTEHFYTFGRLS